MLLHQLKQLAVLDARHLQNLSRSIAQVAVAQSLQESLVNEDCQRCTVGSHFVLPTMEVDSSLDANGGVHSSHDCCGDLDEGGVAPVQVGCQASHI